MQIQGRSCRYGPQHHRFPPAGEAGTSQGRTGSLIMDLLPFLLHIISLHDPHAEVHSRNVNDLASQLARRLGMPGWQVEQVEFSAAVHDIGKIAINDFIVNKPGWFTEAEYMMVQLHSGLGAEILRKLDLDPMIAATVLQHHENFDGTGYPGRL